METIIESSIKINKFGRLPAYCDCPDWKLNIREIDKFIVLGYLHGRDFTGKKFLFCPYCGKNLESK